MSNFIEDYKRGLDSLYLFAPFFYRLARALGEPIESDEIDTACVSFDKDNKAITFNINPDYISEMDSEKVAFVIAHEAYHVLLSHLNEISSKEYKDYSILTVAHECIVNDSIENSLALECPDNLYHGEKYGADFSAFSTKEAYEYLVKNENNDDSNKPSESGCDGFNVSDEDMEDFFDALENAVNGAIKDSNDNNEHLPSEIEDMIFEMGIQTSNSFGIGSDNSEMFVKQDDMNLNWKDLLARINPKVLTAGHKDVVSSWHSPRRKMVSSYPNIILPVNKKRGGTSDNGSDMPTVILALDMSGSIPSYLIGGLANLADSMPADLFDGIPVTWSNSVKEFNTKTKAICSRGGTNIDAVYQYSQKVADKKKSQPYVVVITDGECRFYKETDKDVVRERWFWGAINKNSIRTIKSRFSSYIDNDSVFDVNDFLN